MKRILISTAALAVLCGIGQSHAQEADDEYPFVFLKHEPGALLDWRASLPASMRKVAWIAKLDGVSTRADLVTVGHNIYYYGTVCKPHDCAGNMIAYLIEKGAYRPVVYGVVAQSGEGRRYVGAPNLEARQLLDRKIAEACGSSC